jgi:hypothetical protein
VTNNNYMERSSSKWTWHQKGTLRLWAVSNVPMQFILD